MAEALPPIPLEELTTLLQTLLVGSFNLSKNPPTVKVCRTNGGRGRQKCDVGLDHIVAVRPTRASSLSPEIRDMRVGISTELVYPLSAPEAGLVFPGRIRWSAETESSTWPNTA